MMMLPHRVDALQSWRGEPRALALSGFGSPQRGFSQDYFQCMHTRNWQYWSSDNYTWSETPR